MLQASTLIVGHDVLHYHPFSFRIFVLSSSLPLAVHLL